MLTRQGRDEFLRRAVTVVAVLGSLTLAGCGGGDGVSIGDGQDPDPVVVDFPIAYIQAPLPTDDNGNFEQQDLRLQITFDVGANLFFRQRASVSANEVNITEREIGDMGDVRDVEISHDGSKLLFSMRGPFDPNLDEDEQPTWNLWEYEFDTDLLRRVMPSDLTAEDGHDIMPKYLPDGRIVFASSRQLRTKALLLDESKPAFSGLDEDGNEFAFNLHVIASDGTGLEQVTFNQSHDLDPAILDNGQVVFSRWDNAGANNAINLYRMNPDGSNLELLYGKQSHFTGTNGAEVQFMQPRQTEDGRVMAVIRPFTNTEGGGELVSIDTAQYVENTQPTAPNIGILNGPAQEDATINDVSTAPGEPSEGGRYGSVYPIQDGTGRLLVSWSQCRLIEVLPDDGDPNTVDERIVPCSEENLANVLVQDPDNVVTPQPGDFLVAPPLYGIWMYDPRDSTQAVVVPGREDFIFTEVVVGDPRPVPPFILDGQNDFLLDVSLAENGEAVLNIRSVYDIDGVAVVDIDAMADPAQTLAANRPARFLRIEKGVPLPDDDVRDFIDEAFGVTDEFGMREIVGYAMIEPDGSVMTKVPANAPLAISVLDANGKRISQRHDAWLALGPGQMLTCSGCHDRDSGLSHGRRDAFDSAWAGALTVGAPYPNTDPQWFVGEAGETMAEVRARITCGGDGCSSIEPSMNVVFRDVWSADPAIAAQNADIDYLYEDLTTPPPTSLACMSDWRFNCRSIINYETILHPMWSLPRVDGAGADLTCTNCHTRTNPANGALMVPAGQLELTDGPSIDEPAHFHAYRELVAVDNFQDIINNALVDVTDGNGNVIQIQPPASVAGAIFSGQFFDRFEDPNDLHFNSLSAAERRLIAEWLDVGAQYYNNPFDAPIN